MAFPSVGTYLASAHRNTRKGDVTSRSKFYAGYEQRINRFTWSPKLFYRQLVNLTTANVATLVAYEETINFGKDVFDWTDVLDSTTYQVTLDEKVCPLEFYLWGKTNDKWACNLTFVQATP